MSERPAGELALKLARAELEAGRPDAAAAGSSGSSTASTSFRTWAGGGRPARPLPGRDLARAAPPAARRASSAPGPPTPSRRCCASPPRGTAIALDIQPAAVRPVFQRDARPGLGAPRRGARRAGARPRPPGARAPAFSDTPAEDVAAELDRWAGVWEAVRRAAAPTLVQLGFAAPGGDPLGHHGAGHPGARRSQIAALNAGLAARAAAADVGFVDVADARGARGRGGLVRPARLVHGEDPLRAGGAAGAGAACRGGARGPARAVAPGAGARPRQHALGRRDRRRRGRRHRARAGRRGRGLRRLPGGDQGADRPRHRAGGRLEERPGGGAAAVPRASRDGAEARRHRRLRRQLGAEVREHPRRSPRP